MKKFASILWQHGMIALLCCSMLFTTACTVDQVLSSLDAVLQTAEGLETAVGAVSPADAAALQLLTGLAVKGIQIIQSDYDTYEKDKTASNLQNIVVAAQTLQATLPQNLAAAHISDASAVQKATAWVNLVTTSVASAVSLIAPAVARSSISAHTVKAASLNLSAESIQARWQKEVCVGDTKCGALVKPRHKHQRRL